MDIIKKQEGSKLEVKLVGRLDTTTAPSLEEALVFDGLESLVFDFAELEYVSSAGLRVLLKTYKAMAGKEFYIINAQDCIKELFDITGFSDFLTVR